MKTVKIEISSCKDCPFFKEGMDYSLDGWDRGSDWTCTKKNKMIASFVEWHDKIEIPNWCPLTKEEKK